MLALEETVAHLGRLVAYPTVSSQSNLEMIADLADHLERHMVVEALLSHAAPVAQSNS